MCIRDRVGVYRFQPGLVEETTRSWYGNSPFGDIVTQDGPLTRGRWKIHSPFTANADYGVSYDVIGLDEVQESPLRYCCREEFDVPKYRLLEFLTACSSTPGKSRCCSRRGWAMLSTTWWSGV